MEQHISELIKIADNFVKGGNYKIAIEKYENALTVDKYNIEVLLKKGFTYLLMGNEKVFINIYNEIRPIIDKISSIPVNILNIWKKYESMAAKIAASALIISTITATSCKVKKHSAHRYSSCIYVKPQEMKNYYEVNIDKEIKNSDFKTV